MPRLRVIRPFDPWRSPLCTCPPKYSLHPYTGCSHYCLYCYATSYIGRKPSRPKKRIIRDVTHDLLYIDKSKYVEMSTSSDPYPPIEEKLRITRSILEIMYRCGVKVLITTKSNIVARDADILSKMASAVMITITTLDENLAKKLEPNAPSPTKRLEALRQLSSMDVPVGIRVDPIIIGLNDDPYELEELIGRAKDCGCRHVVTSTYKVRLDNLKRMCEAFPDLTDLWRSLYFGRGIRVHGYIYLPKEIRIELIKWVINAARRYGLTYAVCREGLTSREFFNAPSCDGSHLMKLKDVKGRGAKTNL